MNTSYFSLLYSAFVLSIALPVYLAAATGFPSNSRTETDRLALLAIKARLTDGPHVLRSWNDSLSFCKWQGVTCSPRHQRVITLDLNSQGLVGSLSAYIGNLTFLRSLNLRNNSFHGEIPPEVGRLYRLQDLILSKNLFEGNIPVNISRCTKLQTLRLASNRLKGKIPIDLGSLPNLVTLVLETNNLTGSIPQSIVNISSLQNLSLTYNSLVGSIPDSLGQLKSLRFIALSANALSGPVSPSLYNISSLQIISLSENQLSGSLPQNTLLPNLQELMLAMNNFSGTIPSSLFNASGLLIVDMGDNNLFGEVPTEVGNPKGLQVLQFGVNHLGSGSIDDLNFLTTLSNCSDLLYLDIGENHFGGILPSSIANLSNQLTYLYIMTNQIHGSIPSGIQKYPNLLGLAMHNNFFTGSIPFSIGMLQNLQALSLSGNRLSGKLPSSLWNMSHLYYLDLHNNFLEGNIFSGMTKSQFLQVVDLSNNKFSGIIPEEVIDLSSQIRVLVLSHNSLVGTLPIHLGKLIQLQTLDVSANQMSGEIPSTIADCLSLENLSLQENFFQGPIPASFKSLKEMWNLDLSMNNLSGEIPEYLANLPLLTNLNLSFNNLEGGVPTEGIFKNASAFTIMGNEKLCGGITKLQLSACYTRRSLRGQMSSSLKAALGVGISSIVVTFLVVAIYLGTRAKAKTSLEPISKVNFHKVSYKELHQATDGFSLSNLIGMGSFGSVYRGILNEYQGHVAVKVLNLIEKGASKSFITECNALSKIRHRNLLKILTVCSSVDFKGDDFKALVLMYMPNGSLEKCLHPNADEQYPTRTFSLLQRLNIAIDIASALDYLHNRCETPIIHCDLKPSNILLDEDMVAHVGDFGLAKFLPMSTSNLRVHESSSASPRGTIGYIPPEYGTGAEVSTRGDVYSYGILLLEMFTGKRPTDNIFKEGLTLHCFSSKALPLRVMDIVDTLMPLDEDNDRIEESITSIVQIGVACSAESQSERIGIADVLMELHVIKEVLLGARRRDNHNTMPNHIGTEPKARLLKPTGS